MKEKNRKYWSIIIIIILSLIGGLFGFFGSSIGETFFSSNINFTSAYFTILSVLSPFWVGGIILGIIFIVSKIIRKKINKTKIYFYSIFIYAGIISFNTLAEITDYSKKSFLIIGFVVTFIWGLERQLKIQKQTKNKSMEESIFSKNLKELTKYSQKAHDLGEYKLERKCLLFCEGLQNIIENEPIDPQIAKMGFKYTGNVNEWFEKELESLKKEIKCPKCGSANIKEIESKNDFLSYKAEGEAVGRKIEKTKQKYLCLEENCGHEWEEDLFN